MPVSGDTEVLDEYLEPSPRGADIQSRYLTPGPQGAEVLDEYLEPSLRAADIPSRYLTPGPQGAEVLDEYLEPRPRGADIPDLIEANSESLLIGARLDESKLIITRVTITDLYFALTLLSLSY